MNYKKAILLMFIAFSVYGCDDQPVADTAAFDKPIYIGVHFNEDSAIDCSVLRDKIGDSTKMEAKVKGEVIGVCPDNSCALKMDMGDGTCMTVKMNNLTTPIPKDVIGKTAIVEGDAYIDTTSMEALSKHDSDSNRSASEEVAMDPELTLAFNAKGIIIR